MSRNAEKMCPGSVDLTEILSVLQNRSKDLRAIQQRVNELVLRQNEEFFFESIGFKESSVKESLFEFLCR